MPSCDIVGSGLRVEVIPDGGGFGAGLLERLNGTSTILIRSPTGETTEAIVASDALTQVK